MKHLVIADIHGERDAATAALALADAEGRSIVLLGDLADRGPDSAGTLEMILPRVLSGDIIWIRGNHDDKLGRALAGHNVKGTHGLAGTLREISNHPKRRRLERCIRAGLDTARYWYRIENTLFVHGAFLPDMLDWTDRATAPSHAAWKQAERYALFGQTTGKTLPNGYPERIYDWVDTVPEGLTVIVGHDVRSTDRPVIETGRLGGRAIFLDTGSGKGGSLTAMRLPEETIEQFDCVTTSAAVG